MGQQPCSREEPQHQNDHADQCDRAAKKALPAPLHPPQQESGHTPGRGISSGESRAAQPGTLEIKAPRDTLKKTGQQLRAHAVAPQLEEREGWLDTLGDCGHMVAVGRCPNEGINGDQVQNEKQPLFVDIMGGKTFPMARAMAWCGWKVRVVDKEMGNDLADTEVVEEAANAVANSQAYWITLPFGIWSRTREIHLVGEGAAEGPKTLRSEAEPRGIAEHKFYPPLCPREKATLQEDNELISTTFALCNVGNIADSIRNVENPKRSLLWNFEEADELETGNPSWSAAVFDSCTQGGIRKRGQRVVTRSPLLKNTLDGHLCRHTHHPDEWEFTTEDGRVQHPSAAEQAYTGQFVWNCAVALSWELAVRGWKLKVPGTPGVPVLPPVKTGNKAALWRLLSIGNEVAVKMITDWAIPMFGMQLGMAMPEQKLLIVHSTEELCEDPELWERVRAKAVYCGDGCVKLALRKTEWTNPFKEGRDGGNFEVMIRFGLQFLDLGTAELVKRLSRLKGKQLVSDQRRGEPCHAKLLSALYQHYVHLRPAALLQRSRSRAYVVKRPFPFVI